MVRGRVAGDLWAFTSFPKSYRRSRLPKGVRGGLLLLLIVLGPKWALAELPGPRVVPPRQPAAGRYIGVLRYERPAGAEITHGVEAIRDHLAKLDLVPVSHTGKFHEMIAVLVLYGGNFYSHEYLHFHYRARYNEETRQLTFSAANQSLIVQTTHWDTSRIEAEVIVPPPTEGFEADFKVAERNQIKATLIVGRESNPVLPKYPLVPQLDGEYRGMCNDIEQTVSISTWRNNVVSELGTDSFALYQIAGYVGSPSKRSGLSISPFGAEILKTETGIETTCTDWIYNKIGRPCVYDSYNGLFNIYTAEVTLSGSQEPLRCFLNSKGLNCDRRGLRRGKTAQNAKIPTCQLDRVWTWEDYERMTWAFKRVPDQTGALIQHKPMLLMPTSQPKWPALNPSEPAPPSSKPDLQKDPSGIPSGTYWGLIHHEDRNQYQQMTLQIRNLKYSPDGGPARHFLSVSANLIFEGPPNIVLPYKFPDLPFTPGQKEFVFENADFGLDPFFRMTILGDGAITGVWGSTFKGIIGTFHAFKDRVPKRPTDVVSNPFAFYRSQRWQLRITPLRNFVSGAGNPFEMWTMNLTATGLKDGEPYGALRPSVGGSFDFYTDNIQVGEFMTGYRPDSSSLRLRHLYGMPLAGGIPIRRFATYRLVNKGGSPLNRGTRTLFLDP